MFHLDISKVDLGVGHVTVATHTHVSSACFIYFGLKLQKFYLDVLKVDRVLQVVVRLLLLLRHRRGPRVVV
jgi:hypothetical protein